MKSAQALSGVAAVVFFGLWYTNCAGQLGGASALGSGGSAVSEKLLRGVQKRTKQQSKDLKHLQSKFNKQLDQITTRLATLSALSSSVAGDGTGAGAPPPPPLESSPPLPSPVLARAPVAADFKMASDATNGFFDDVLEKDWKMKMKRYQETPNCGPDNCQDDSPNKWYQFNWEPTFSCSHERRVGGMGDGPKWVCDPHRIKPKDCLVYSFGSNNNFFFEESVLREISPDCEIHTFDPMVDSRIYNADKTTIEPSKKPASVHLHPWGLGSGPAPGVYKSMEDVVTELGHKGRQIDIFKIDCEGCEWKTFTSWFGKDVKMRQILVEVHYGTDANSLHTSSWPFMNNEYGYYGTSGDAHRFLTHLQEQGYAVFHKEPNIAFDNNCLEYALVQVGTDFTKRTARRNLNGTDGVRALAQAPPLSPSRSALIL